MPLPHPGPDMEGRQVKDIQSGCRAGRREGSVRDLRRYDDVVVHVDTTPSHLVEWLNKSVGPRGPGVGGGQGALPHERQQGQTESGRSSKLVRTAALDFWQLDSSVSDETLGSVFRPWDDHPIGDVNRRIAAAYSVDRAFVTTNGTTSANVLCCFTLLQPGDHVLVERDCHISVLQAISLIGARPIWITPAFDPSLSGSRSPRRPRRSAMRFASNRGPRLPSLHRPSTSGLSGSSRRSSQLATKAVCWSWWMRRMGQRSPSTRPCRRQPPQPGPISSPSRPTRRRKR